MGTTKLLRFEISLVDSLLGDHREVDLLTGAILMEIFRKWCFEELPRIHRGRQPLGKAKMLTLFSRPHFKESLFKKSEAV